VVAIPALSVFTLTAWITTSSNGEPWSSIVLSSLALAGLAGGSVAGSADATDRVGAYGIEISKGDKADDVDR
jgi:two-component system, NarL family, sensor kinase